MIHCDRNYRTEQLRRLSGLPGFPRTHEALSSLLEPAYSFETDAGLRRFCDDWLREGRKAPVPADLWEAIRISRPAKAQGDYECTYCYDTKESVADFLVTWLPGGRKQRQRITTEQAAELVRKDRESVRLHNRAILSVCTQMIYQGPVKCPHCQQSERKST